jgi:8-oxo-dGTP pyrophosphatase MutT (NUDIX family)
MENENEVPVAFIVAITGDGVVYLKRSDYDDIEPGKWCLPSGHVENGETHKDAAVRELYEETGIKAGPEELEHLATFPYLLDGTKYSIWLYLVEKGGLGLEDVKIFAEEHSEKKCIGTKVLAEISKLRTDSWDKFTAIDRHIIANYVPEAVTRIKEKENGTRMHSISKAF